jgi:hypothetical protein
LPWPICSLEKKRRRKKRERGKKEHSRESDFLSRGEAKGREIEKTKKRKLGKEKKKTRKGKLEKKKSERRTKRNSPYFGIFWSQPRAPTSKILFLDLGSEKSKNK